jgi:hypothetical protein
LFIFRRGADTVYLLLYVDDIILTASSTTLLCRTVSALRQEFVMKDLGPLHHFLGITVKRRSDGMFLHQRTYMLNIIKRATMTDCKPCTTPVDLQTKLVADSGPPVQDASQFQSIAGALQYLTLHTTRHHLRRATDLSAYAQSSRASSDGHEAHPTLPPGDAGLRPFSASFE